MGHVNNLSCQIKNSMCFNIIGPSDLSRGSTHPWACELYHLHAEISEQQCEISSSKYMINHDNIIIYNIYIYIYRCCIYGKNTCSTFKRSQFYESGSQVSRTLNFIKKSLNQNHFKYPWQLLYETTDLPPKKRVPWQPLANNPFWKKTCKPVVQSLRYLWKHFAISKSFQLKVRACRSRVTPTWSVLCHYVSWLCFTY